MIDISRVLLSVRSMRKTKARLRKEEITAQQSISDCTPGYFCRIVFPFLVVSTCSSEIHE
jgi:hypothetical protein